MTDTDVIARIQALDDQRAAVTIAKDRAAMARLLADDLRYVHGSATEEDKTTYIERATTGFYDYRALTPIRRDYRVIGDVVLVNGDVQIDVVVNGTPKNFRSRYLQAWRRNGGDWQMCAWQSTPVAGA